MASAKKGKKNKGKTLALSDFLQETPGTVSTMPIRKSATNWADEVEDNHDMYESRSTKTSVILPTAPKASRDFDEIIDKVPQDPPYIAYLSNLPYDVDENEISYFFRNMKISNMRIPKDERPGEAPRLKGFGYVEFEDRESLLNALVIPDTTIKNRRIRIEIATDYENDKRRTGRMDMNRERSNRSEMTSFGDWRSGPRQESSDDRRGFSRDKDREDTSSMWRDNDRRNNDRDKFSRSTGFREDRDDKFMRRYDNNDKSGRNEGFTRGPPPQRNREEKNKDEDSNKNEPRQRPKLMLTPRTKPVETEAEKPSASAAIFGNAKPVDTAARERQIEERLAKDKDSDAAPRRELSRERDREKDRDRRDKEKDNYGEDGDREPSPERYNKEKKEEKVPEIEKKPIEKEKSAATHNQKTDVNGVVQKEKSHVKRNGDHEKKVDSEKHKVELRKREEKKEKPEREMPKLKKAEPPNFVANNKFAFLENEDGSDD